MNRNLYGNSIAQDLLLDFYRAGLAIAQDSLSHSLWDLLSPSLSTRLILLL